MNYKRKIILLTSLLLLYLILASYAQEAESTAGEEEAPAPYSASRWYYNLVSPQRSGVSYFSAGYNYFYRNFDVTIKLLDVGVSGTLNASTSITALFSGLVSLGVGYDLHSPFNVTQYKLMEHIGQFTLGWYPSAMNIVNKSSIGLMNLYAQKTNKRRSMRLYRNTSTITAMLVNVPDIVRLDTQARFVYDYTIDYNEHLYEVYFNTSVVQDHGFGELALKPFVSYTNSIGTVKEIKMQKNLLQNMTFSIFGPVPFYNFAGGTLFEYRFFFLSFLNTYQWYEDFYISATYNIAYIKDDTREVGEVKMYYGGGLGFNLFDSVPFSLQFLMDEDANMGFSIVSTIIPPY